ncbi:MAG: hypothetical protein WCP22_08615 [Chlamydiota bacterium]
MTPAGASFDADDVRAGGGAPPGGGLGAWVAVRRKIVSRARIRSGGALVLPDGRAGIGTPAAVRDRDAATIQAATVAFRCFIEDSVPGKQRPFSADDYSTARLHG